MAERISVWSYQTSKSKKWALEVRFPKENRKIQRRGFGSFSEAQRAAKQLRLDTPAPVKTSQATHTVSETLDDYLASLKGSIREHTRANYADILKRYVVPSFGHMDISLVSEPEISKLFGQLRDSGLRPGTVNTIRARTIGLFNYALQRRIIQFNSAAQTRVQSKRTGEDTVVRAPLSAKEAATLLEASEGTFMSPFLALCLGLGLRKGEALGLKWSDIDLIAGEITIRRSRGQIRNVRPDGKIRSIESDGEVKTLSAARTLSLNATVMTALLDLMKYKTPRGEDYVVSPGNGRPLSISVLTRQYKKLIQTNGLRYVRIHDLRHTAAVLALESRAPLEAVSQALGHSGIEITKRIYAPRVKALNAVFSESLDLALGQEGFLEKALEVTHVS